MSRFCRRYRSAVPLMTIVAASAVCVWQTSADEVLEPLMPSLLLPTQAASNAGFDVSVDVAEHQIAGYVPVEISVAATATFSRDRRLVFRFRSPPGGRTPPRHTLVLDVPVDLIQGTTRTQTVRYLPKWACGNAFAIQLLEDGQPLIDYDGIVGMPALQGRRPNLDLMRRENREDWVFVDDADFVTANQRAIVKANFAAAIGQVRSGQGRLGLAGGVELSVTGRMELPTDWRGLQRSDVVFISEPSLRVLADKNEEAFHALRNWVLSGGVLIGWGAESPQSFSEALGTAWTNEPEASELVIRHTTGYMAQLKLIAEERARSQKQVRRFLTLTGLNRPLTPQEMNEARASGFSMFSMGDIAAAKEELRRLEFEEAQWEALRTGESWASLTPEQWAETLWLQPTGAGQVVGLSDPEIFDAPVVARFLQHVVGIRRSATLRRGVDPMLGDRRFTRWLIPGVAQPPVYTFIGLLTVFVVLVGPVAYRRTTRYGRGYLMFAIAPVLAMITTMAMFGYGVLADGFGTVARVRQLTWIDGVSGDAGERIRSTYFAGIRPGDGLRFSPQAEVMAYPRNEDTSWEKLNEQPPGLPGTVLISEDQQRFGSAFLPSREQRQFVVHEPRRNVGTVRLQVGSGGAVSVVSTFGFAVREIVVRDKDGGYWAVTDLGAGETATAEELDVQEASKTLGDMYNAYRPVSEVREAQQRRNYRAEVRDVILNLNRSMPEGTKAYTEGVFEQWLTDNLQLKGEIPRGHFVATAEVSQDVLALDDVELVESVRYVYGTMP